MTIEPGRESLLRAAGLADLDAMMRAEAGKAVGWHRNREAVPLEIAVDGAVTKCFLKRVFKIPPKHSFWPLLRGRRGISQPRQEWTMLGELEKAAIPAMRRIAFGERRQWGMPIQAFVLVETVPMPFTLEHWLVPGFPRPASIDDRERGRLFHKLGGLIGRLHAAGFLWPDMVAKHIFADRVVGGTAAGHWRFCLIDVERMTRVATDDESRTVEARLTAKHLGALRKSLLPMALTEMDSRRFCAGYRRERTRNHQASGRKEPHSWPQIKKTWIDGKLAPRLPDDFEHPRRVTLSRHRGMIADARVAPLLIRAGLTNLKDVMAYQGGDNLQKPGLPPFRDRIRLELCDNVGDKGAGCNQKEPRIYYLKRFHKPPFREQLRRMRESRITMSSAWREVHFIKVLTLLGIPAARSVAFGQKMKGFREVASFSMTEEIRGESLEKLADLASNGDRAVPPWKERREIVRQLALVARRLHNHNLFHRDLYLCHVFLTHNADGGVVLHLLDLARMLANPACRRRWVVKDLAALDYSAPTPLVTRADRLRFLYHYLPNARESHSAVRELISLVGARVRRMAGHDRSRTDRFQRSKQA